MKLRRLLACGLITITALTMCSCGKEDAKKGSDGAGSGSETNSHEGTYIVVDEIEKDDKKTFVLANENGTIKLTGYDEVDDFFNNAAVVKKYDYDEHKSTYAIIDTKEKEIVPFGKYAYISRKDDYGVLYDFFEVEDDDDNYGIIDGTGKEIVPCKYEDISASYFTNIEDENGEDTSIFIFKGETDTDDVYDVYSRFGAKIISGYLDSDKISYFSLNNKSTNSGIFIHEDKDETKIDFISEKTGKSILTLSDTEEVDYSAYITGLISYYNKSTNKYETYMTSADGTSVIKLDYEEFINTSRSTDKYRIIVDNSDEKAFVYDESGKLVESLDCDGGFYEGDFYVTGEGNNARYFSQSSAKSYDVYDADLKKINQFEKVEVCESFYAGKTDSNSDTFTIYDLNDNVLYENAVKNSNVTYSYKIGNNKIIQYFESGNYKNYLILDENQEKVSGLHHGYTLVKTIDPSDSSKNSYSIYDYNEKICDIGSKSVEECDNVNLYIIGNKYYNYNGKLIYEKGKAEN